MKYLRILVILILAFTAFDQYADARNAWTTPHVLTISDASDPTTLNPHLSQSAPTANMSEMTMAWLLRWDIHNQPIPELATQVPSKTNGGVSADGLTITYHLRKGVKWSDGRPFSADDVVFSANVVNDPANNEGTRFNLKSITAPDKYTVIVRLKKPDSTFLEGFFTSCCANPSLLPKHLLSQYPNINNVPYNDLPVGIGPFKFARWDRGKQVVMVADPLYWRGTAKLHKIIYKIESSSDALFADLSDHTVDLWYQFSGAYLPRIKTLPEITLIRRPSYAWNHISFNVTHPAVADVQVRRALRMALNRQGYVDQWGNGVGIVKDAAVPVSAPYFSDLGTTHYDPTAANALLDQAGWIRGADGIRSKGGVRLELAVAIVDRPDTVRLMNRVSDDWKQIGAAMHLDRYPAGQFFRAAQEGGTMYGNAWDAVMFAFAADPVGDYRGYLSCDQFPPAGANVMRWCNKDAEAAMNSLPEHYQPGQRAADVRTLMQAYVEDTPSIVMQIREDLFAFNSDLRGYNPNTLTPFGDMLNVDI